MEMGVVDVSEHSQQLSVYMLDGFRKGRREVSTGFCREYRFIVQSLLYPGDDIVYVSGGRELDLAVIRVNPSIIQVRACRHCWTSLSGAAFRYDPVEQIKTIEQVEYVYSDPFGNIYVFG